MYIRNCKCAHSTGLVVVIFKLGSNGISTGKMQCSASQPTMHTHSHNNATHIW